jgi:WD40 repeat protein
MRASDNVPLGRSRLTAAVAQVLDLDGVVVGAAFLIAERTVLTCAHVVVAAGSGPGRTVTLRFPQVEESAPVVGRVRSDAWAPSESEDVAVLTVERPPQGAVPLHVGAAAGCRGHAVSSFGFPGHALAGGHHGYAVAGDLVNTTTGAGFVLQLTEANDLTRGFSGGPALDERTEVVIGMVTSIVRPDDYLRGTALAYATPTEVLRRIVPGIGVVEVEPYRGLQPYGVEHSAWFCGRADAIDMIIGQLRLNLRGVLLLGPSGAGKSSVVNAGVLPALAGGQVPGSDRWHLLSTRPGPGAASALTAANHSGAHTAVVIDQFEELLMPASHSELDRARGVLLDLIVGGLGTPSLTLILVMRDDLYPELARHAPAIVDPGELSLVNIPATLSRRDLGEIIEHPATAAGARFQSGLVDRIIADIAEVNQASGTAGTVPATVLPLLGTALHAVWQRRDDNVLTHEAYVGAGKVSGAIATSCDAIMARLPASQREIAERMLVALVRPADPERGIPPVRQQVSLTELRDLAADQPAGRPPDTDSAIDDVLRTLVDNRLVITGLTLPSRHETDGEPAAELVHEALIRDWSTLRHWLEEGRRFHEWLGRVNVQRLRWEAAHGASADDLLRGTDLAEGLRWARQRGLPRTVSAFVIASHRQQRARLRRARRLNVVFGALLVLAIAAAGVAVAQGRSANDARNLATSRLLAAQSTAVAISNPDLGALLAVAAYRVRPTSEARSSLYAAATGPLVRRLADAGEQGVTSAAFSPAGQFVATAHVDGTVRLRTTDGRLVRTLPGLAVPSLTLAFSPTGTTLATVDADGAVLLSDTTTGHHRTLSGGPAADITRLAYTADGRTIIAADQRGVIRLWEADTGTLQSSSSTGHGGVVDLQVSPDGSTVLTTTEEGWATVWNTSSGSPHRAVELPTSSTSLAPAALSPDGRVAAAVAFDGSVWLWSRDTGAVLPTGAGAEEAATSVAFSPDSLTLVTGHDGGIVRSRDVASGSPRLLLTGLADSVTTVTVAPDGRSIAAGDSTRVGLWDAQSGQLRTIVTGRGNLLTPTVFSPNGDLLVVPTAVGTATRLVDARTGASRTSLPGHVSDVRKAVFSPDNRTLVTVDTSGAARLWNPNSGQPIAVLSSHPAGVAAVAFAPDGAAMASVGNYALRLWDTSSHRLIAHLDEDSGSGIDQIAFSPDGRTIATSDHAVGTTRLWDRSTGRPRFILTGHAEGVRKLAFSPDSGTVAIASSDGTARTWNTATGEVRAVFTGHTHGAVTSLLFAADGRTMVTGGNDRTIRVWDAHTGKPGIVLRQPSGVTALGLAGTDLLVSGGDDGSVRVWNLRDGRLRSRFTSGAFSGAMLISPDHRTTGPSPWPETTARSTYGTCAKAKRSSP